MKKLKPYCAIAGKMVMVFAVVGKSASVVWSILLEQEAKNLTTQMTHIHGLKMNLQQD